MMRSVYLPMVLSLCFTSAVYAQIPNVSREALISIAEGELEGFAERAGYRLRRNHLPLTIPKSSWAMIPITVPSLGVAAVGAAVVAAVVSATFSAPALGVAGLSTLYGVADAVDGTLAGDPYYLYKVHFVHHYRSEFHYILEGDGGRAMVGSCLLFFAGDESGYTLDIEIDECSHDRIFPEEAVGIMRVGGWVDPIERSMSDQDEVVVSKSIRLDALP